MFRAQICIRSLNLVQLFFCFGNRADNSSMFCMLEKVLSGDSIGETAVSHSIQQESAVSYPVGSGLEPRCQAFCCVLSFCNGHDLVRLSFW